MKKYQVYGIGNALVDSEFAVDDAFFVEYGIEKGFMTLVDHEYQSRLVNVLTETVGVRKRAGGGSAANSLYALSQFGGRAFFCGKVAKDEIGDFYISQLGDLNIDTNLAKEANEGTTGQCLVMVTPDAERTMHTFLGISETVSPAQLDFYAITQSEYVYIEGYLVTSPSAREAARELKRTAEENGVKVAMTFSDPAMVEYFAEPIGEVLGSGVDLLFCNEKEALLWTNQTDVDAACEELRHQARQFVVTRGSKGARLFDGNDYIDIAASPVQAIDTNGAGDMFAGAFLYGITSGKDFATAGKLASHACARLVTSFGPRLEPHEHQEILVELGLN